jgi:aspartate aminotransferase
MKVSKRAENLSPSMTLAISAKAKQLRAEGVDVIGFGAGEPDFDTPEPIKDAAIESLKSGFTKYVPAAGVLELREAIAEYYREEFGLPYKATNAIVSVGGKGVLYGLMQALLDPGDEALLLTPYWVSYPPMVELAGGVPVYVETTDATGFLATADAIQAKITPKTKLLILNSPSNPTGSAYNREQLAEIAEVVIENDLFVVSDEIYGRIVYEDFEFVPFPAIDERLIDRCLIADGMSKTYSMTGWRLGYGVGPESIIKAMTKIQSHATSGTCSFVQKGGLAGLTGNQDDVSDMLGAFSRRRDMILARLAKIDGVECFSPQGAFYVFPRVSAYYGKQFEGKVIDGSLALADYLLDTAKVAIVPGVAFGADDYIRLSYATDDDSINEGLDRIENALKKLS